MRPEDAFAIYRYHKELSGVLDFTQKKDIQKKDFFDTIFDSLK